MKKCRANDLEVQKLYNEKEISSVTNNKILHY